MEHLLIFVLSFIYGLSAVLIGADAYREFKPDWDARTITWFQLGGALFLTLAPGFNTFVIIDTLLDTTMCRLSRKFYRPVFRPKTSNRPAA